MPSPSMPVHIPPELRGDYQPEPKKEARSIDLPINFLISLVMLLVGTAMVGFGVGTWAGHPGAGIAAAGLVIVMVAVLIGYQA